MLQTILLPLDGSTLSEQALPYAASLARRADARIVLVRATQAHTILDVDASDAQIGVISRAEHDLRASAARLRGAGVEAEIHVYYDQPAPAILDAARRHEVDLIVMSTHGRSGLGRVVYGSVADEILRHAEVPVLLIPPTIDPTWPTDQPLTILVTLDGSALAEEALISARLLAELLGARLHLLRVVEQPVYPLAGDGYAYIPFDDTAELLLAREYLSKLAGRLRASSIGAEIEVVVGLPGAVIPRVAQEQQAHVIAMATHGRSGLARLVLGSVTTGTLQRAHVPLLLIRPTALDRPAPVDQPSVAESVAAAASVAEDREAPAVTVSLTPPELGLVREAVESLLLSTRQEDEVSASLRVILGRLPSAQPGAAEPTREVVGAR
jgi:nucleotide-binding universal stress UspA family protein